MSDRKVAVFIDGQNLYRTSKSLGLDIDFKKLLTELNSLGGFVRVKYYTCVDEDDDNSSIVPLLDWLSYNGYSVVTKYVRGFTDADGKTRLRGKIDVELTVDAMELCRNVDQVVLVAGSGDFSSLLQAIQRLGPKCSVISSVMTDPPICADSLRRQADEFIELKTLAPRIQREGGPRTDRRAVSLSSVS